ncbi:Beta-glucosidase [Quillaja saponaria]|uniref:Beta-glucosidase n=1 Tax=Quillaja saponaria TaxID=32244 RepID=A0AAD7VNV5_QUISA|nr:Beta-glucosidase [Quillaja saponaria]
MRMQGLVLLLVFFIVLVESVQASLNRSSFPDGFLFGAASSAYQYEGAAYGYGKGPSIFDTFTRRYPDKIKDHSSGVLAVDSYHRYKEDVGIMKEIGLDAYRFSISWSRVLPSGKLSGGVNQEGIKYYNNLINELLSNGIEPFVTLFHWDLPQALEDEYDGFLSSKIVKDFADYADLCYKEFGDRVKHWITLNEPMAFSSIIYTIGTYAPPQRCYKWLAPNCTYNSTAERYIVAHNQILAHAAAVKVYRENYQISQKGEIGISLNSLWIIPLTKSKADKDAASRALDFTLGWYMEPLNSGSYPAEMYKYVGGFLPSFSREQSLMVKGSFDFIGLNYYTSNYAADIPCNIQNPSIFPVIEYCVNLTTERNGKPIGPKVTDYFYIYPKGIRELLLYTKNKLNNPVIYITENGVNEINNGIISLEDDIRIHYIHHHLSYLRKSIVEGVNVKGYLTWSLLDNFEWTEGFTLRYGLVFVDYNNGLKRYPKKSAYWFKEFLH